MKKKINKNIAWYFHFFLCCIGTRTCEFAIIFISSASLLLKLLRLSTGRRAVTKPGQTIPIQVSYIHRDSTFGSENRDPTITWSIQTHNKRRRFLFGFRGFSHSSFCFPPSFSPPTPLFYFIMIQTGGGGGESKFSISHVSKRGKVH